MKQTKKLTRNHRQLLEKNGYTDMENYRYCTVTPSEFVFFNVKSGKTFSIEK